MCIRDSGGNINNPEFRELMIRWFQYATFSPILRMHGDRQPHKKALGLSLIHIFKSNYIQADETTLQVIDNGGKESKFNKYMWLYKTHGDNNYI